MTLENYVLELIERTAWDAQAEAWQYRVPFDSARDWHGYLRHAVDAGVFKLMDIMVDGRRSGLLIYSLDESVSRELVVVAAYCDNPHLRALPFLQVVTFSLAQRLNCDSIRFHTRRAGLIREAIKAGWQLSEVILRNHALKHLPFPPAGQGRDGAEDGEPGAGNGTGAGAPASTTGTR